VCVGVCFLVWGCGWWVGCVGWLWFGGVLVDCCFVGGGFFRVGVVLLWFWFLGSLLGLVVVLWVGWFLVLLVLVGWGCVVLLIRWGCWCLLFFLFVGWWWGFRWVFWVWWFCVVLLFRVWCGLGFLLLGRSGFLLFWLLCVGVGVGLGCFGVGWL